MNEGVQVKCRTRGAPASEVGAVGSPRSESLEERSGLSVARGVTTKAGLLPAKPFRLGSSGRSTCAHNFKPYALQITARFAQTP